jgi:hypothetical protein
LKILLLFHNLNGGLNHKILNTTQQLKHFIAIFKLRGNFGKWVLRFQDNEKNDEGRNYWVQILIKEKEKMI